MGYTSLFEPLRENIEEFPDKTAYILIQDNDIEEQVTFSELNGNIQSAATAMKNAGLCRGDIVILALRHSHQLIASFWAAQYIGATPTIFPYPAPMQNHEKYREKLRNLVNNSGARATVVISGWKDNIEDMDANSHRLILDEELIRIPDTCDGCIDPDISRGEEIAYIQYTSGSTGLQKGVMLSHRAILNFTASFVEGIDFREGDTVVNWLPLYHDFGLFAGFVVPLICRFTAILLSPFKWVRNPKLLMDVITKFKATMCWMPNFGFNHSVRSIPESRLKGIDLTSLRTMGSGGEPIQFSSQQKFITHFHTAGFRPASMTTGYGMAENTLTVSIGTPNIPPTIDWVDSRSLSQSNKAVPTKPDAVGAIPIASCGPPVPGVEIRIEDKHGNILEQRQKGQIVIRSNSLFSGYHQRPDLTEQVLKDGWYFTGDMGYMASGELYITGRMKDLIIIGGENIHPEDLEAIAASTTGIQADRCVSFGIHDPLQGTEKIILICNLERSVVESEKARIEKALRRKVMEEMGITLGEVLLVNNGWIIKTQNGKLARNANREKYLAQLGNRDA